MGRVYPASTGVKPRPVTPEEAAVERGEGWTSLTGAQLKKRRFSGGGIAPLLNSRIDRFVDTKTYRVPNKLYDKARIAGPTRGRRGRMGR